MFLTTSTIAYYKKYLYKLNRNNKNIGSFISVSSFKLKKKCGEYEYLEGCWPCLISFRWSHKVWLDMLLNYELYLTLLYL